MTQSTADTRERPTSFTGRRRRKTRRSVIIKDRIARYTISIGGIGVVVAFAAIVLFLCAVVLPLFAPPHIAERIVVPLAEPATAPGQTADGAAAPAPLTQPAMPVAMEPDENLIGLWLLDDQGMLATYRTAGGELVKTERLSDRPVTAISNARGVVAIGRDDGTARVGRITFQTEWISEMSDAMESLRPGESIAHDGGVAELTPIGQVRLVRVHAEMSDPLAVGEGEASPVHLIDYIYDEGLEAIVALREDGRLFFDLIRKKRNMMTGKYSTSLEKYELPWSQSKPADERPIAVLMGQNGRMVYTVYEDGHLVRYDTTRPAEAYIVEETDVLPDSDRRVTSVEMLLGNITLIVADDRGGVSGWFPASYPEGQTPQTKDWLHMVQAHRLPDQEAAVTTIATSARDRQFLTGDARGHAVLRHMTSGTVQATIDVAGEQAVQLLSMAPKNNAIFALDASGTLSAFDLNNPHADASMKELFLPVHYEGYAQPQHIWQSSAGTDDAEPKHGLMPLIFGTLKATFYAMLFAVPIALLASIYSSEFMQPRVRTVVKPLVEMMAGLPSVVLGFIAALVLAPFLENVLPALLVVFAAIPVGVLLFGFIWQSLPPDLTRGAPRWLTFVIMLGLIVLAVMFAFAAGPFIETILFYGDIRGWLDRRIGTGPLGATPGWIVLLTPLAAVALVRLVNAHVRPRLSVFHGQAGRMTLGLAEVTRFVVIAGGAVLLAAGVGAGLSALGLDLRDPVPAMDGGFIGTYVQRNTLIIGMIMGFAIIPIIYTVSEDALSSVPASLRSAALGAGATPWQTAMRVVLPVAMSGIFSACMIGFGRAAGETMIVLMAGGNTAILDPNIFNGVRPLSANIAVELPEAPVGSSHYRILFLSALVLFAMTFVLNTAAELVRARFRKRAFQL